MSWAGAFLDLTILRWLPWRKTRPFAYTLLVTFHIATGLLFPPSGLFSWIITGAALIFFDPDWLGRLVRRLRRPNGALPATTPAPLPQTEARSLSWPVRAALLLGVVFLAVQALVPLRRLAYPGNVRWTEEGYRFSWRVLVTEKTGLVKFRVNSNAANEDRIVYPEEYQPPTQVERMAYQPDMILATAHIIRDDLIRRGRESVLVRADAFVTYTGRPSARPIDPEVDLPASIRGSAPTAGSCPRQRRR